MTTVRAIKCSECNCTIFSRARHDFRRCLCGRISIDGGFDYVELNFPADKDIPKIFDLEVDQTPMELYEDWNTRRDKYGLFQPNDGGRDEQT